MSLARVKKREGTEVPFDKGRIQSAVAAAQAAVGEEDPGFAGEVADLVEFALRRRYAMDGGGPGAEGVPEVEEIQDLVELALIQLGRAAVAKAYILYRDRRARVRESRGAGEGAAPSSKALSTVRVREQGGSSRWSKGRIVAALVDEAQLSRSVAHEVAVRVERRVVSSGLKRISTALVRELVDNELVAMGLAAALARHEPVSIPRHDLRQLLEYGPPAGAESDAPRWLAGRRLGEDGVEGRVAGEILGRFALEDVFDEQSAERFAAGELFVEDGRRPHLHLVQAVPCELFLRGSPGPRAAFELLDELAGAAASVSRGVVLEAPGALLQPLLRGGRAEPAGSIGAWLLALCALGRASARRFDLSRPGTRAAGVLSRIVDELAELAQGDAAPLPRLFLGRAELAALLEHRAAAFGPGRAAESREAPGRLMIAGVLVPTWSRPEELFVGPGCVRRGREQGALACGGAIALNLARVARRAGPWREDLALEELARLVEAAVDALAQLAGFQRRTRAARAGEARGRIAYAITPIGLREALRALGDGELRPAQGARLLGLISDAARRFAARRGLSVVLTPFFGRRAAARFARLAAAEPRVSQGLLFGELARAALERSAALSTGYDLGAAELRIGEEEPGAAEAELLSTVPTGAWLQPAGVGGALAEQLHVHGSGRGHASGSGSESALGAWQRFDHSREQRRAAAPPPPLATAPPPSPPLFPTGDPGDHPAPRKLHARDA